jgi:CRP-like cAMP-binding protein
MLGNESREAKELKALLRQFPAFANLDEGDLSALVNAGSHFALPAGWPLVQEGIPADDCYIIASGTARVFHNREPIAEVGPGDFVGERAVLHGTLRSATVTSSSHISGMRIGNDAVRKLLTERPALAETLREIEAEHEGTSAE